MNPEDRKHRIETLFHEALTRAPDQRSAFLGQACAGDEELRLKLQELLDAYAAMKTATLTPGADQGAPFSLPGPDVLLALGDRYEDIRFLGGGGMGLVFRARDREIDKVVALKVLHPSLANNEAMIGRFRKEIRFALDITHKNVCRTYGLERINGVLFIAMEYVDGETLRSLLDRVKGVSLTQGLFWSLEICDALAAAHEKGIVHRDLKPENIMVDRDGHIKVMDFGIARSLRIDPQGSGIVVGTPLYMSPEQALGRAVEPSSDIYSLGLVLYELFTGVLPDPVRVVAPGQVSHYLPAHLDRAICKCLDKDPKGRFQNTKELSQALEGQDPSSVGSSPGGERVPSLSRRNLQPLNPKQRSHEPEAGPPAAAMVAGARENQSPEGAGPTVIATKVLGLPSRLRRLGLDVLRAFTVFIAFIGLHLYLEARSFGGNLKNFEYAMLHQTITSESGMVGPLSSKSPRLPVVIDISPFRQDKSQPTDRGRLEELVDTLNRMNAAAIGVDIDFSPDDQGRFITPRDPQLFLKWQQYGNVRVGIFRRGGDKPGRWLGNPDFRSLAAGIMLPEGDAQRAYYFSSPVHSRSPEDYLPQMPAALHAILQRSAVASATRDPRIRATYVGEGIAFGDYPVDYSFVDQIQRIPYESKGDLDHWKEQIDRHVVLVGDLQDAGDSRCTGVHREPVQGVLIQACAFATLNRGLLWQVDDRTNLLCDLGLLFVVISVIGAVRLVQASVPPLKFVSPRSLEIVSCQCAACSVLIVASSFVSITHFFWPDFLWVAIGLFLYPYLAEIVVIFWNGARGFIVAATTRGTSDAH